MTCNTWIIITRQLKAVYLFICLVKAKKIMEKIKLTLVEPLLTLLSTVQSV